MYAVFVEVENTKAVFAREVGFGDYVPYPTVEEALEDCREQIAMLDPTDEADAELLKSLKMTVVELKTVQEVPIGK